MNFYEKYQKYKMKYVQLQKLNKQKGGMLDTIEEFKTAATGLKAISFHDPLGTGLISGDKDDHVALMFEALVFGDRLTVVIMDGEKEGKDKLNRFSNESLQRLIKDLEFYKCVVIDGNRIDLVTARIEETSPQIALICAPLNDGISHILNNWGSIKKMYIQGNIPNNNVGDDISIVKYKVGVNFNGSYDDAKLHMNSFYGGRLEIIPSEYTTIALDLDKLPSYKEFKYHDELQHHVLAQLLGLPDVSLNYAFGLIIKPEDLHKIEGYETEEYSGSGITNKKLGEMVDFLQKQDINTEENPKQNLLDAIDKYITNLLINKFKKIIDQSDPSFLDSERRLQKIIDPSSSLFVELKGRLKKVAIIAEILLVDPLQIIDSTTGSICSLGTLPKLTVKDIKYTDETPILYDFIAVVVALKHYLPIFKQQEQEQEQQIEKRRKYETLEDIYKEKNKNLYTKLFNEIIKQFKGGP
jgi:hypothetical protein